MKYALEIISVIIALFMLACGNGGATDPGEVSPMDSLLVLSEAFNQPEECRSCHPNHYREWQTSMHAYAFVDPVFFTLNDIGQARSNQQLDQFCVKCHSPLASLLQETPPGFDRSSLSPLAQKGVQCDVCHLIADFERGKSITEFRLDKVRQGPIPDPQSNAFHESEFDNRYNRSGICSACHDVIAPSGIQIEFTSTEWDNSPYAAMGLHCQGCHMPQYSGQAAVGGPERLVHRHRFIGVDIPLVDFPGRQETIAEVDNLLKHAASISVTAPEEITANSDIEVSVEIQNEITGHNIPSGTTFERQMWLELLLSNMTTGEIVYSSGTLDDNGDLLNHHSEFVKDGTLAEDTDLTLFHGIPFKDGKETLFFWEADFIEDKTIPPFESRTARYSIPAPSVSQNLELSVRLRFRSFPPYFLRAIGEQNLVENVLIFDMKEFSQIIRIN